MPGFNIVRAGRNKEGYMEELIQNMYTDTRVFYKQGYGTWYSDPEAVLNSFRSVRNTFHKTNLINVHYMEIFIEQEYGRAAAVAIFDLIGRYLLEEGFQSFITIADCREVYAIAVVINAVSYRDGTLYHDNNRQSMRIYNLLCGNLDAEWEILVTENTFFDTKNGSANYRHGKYI